VVVVSIGLVLGLSAPAWAVAIYTYTGNPFTSATSPYTTQDRVSGAFTLPAPLAPNQTDIAPEVSSWTLTDGVGVFSSDHAGGGLFGYGLQFSNVSTDSLGDITTWTVAVILGGIDIPTAIVTNNLPGHSITDDGDCLTGPCLAFNAGMPGVWAIAPEPTTSTLLAAGVLALSCVRRRIA
jgi:hypothetical protein